jgi:hypothetical protein
MKKLLIVVLLVVVLLAKSSKKHKEPSVEEWTKDDLFFYGMSAGAFVSGIGFIAAFLLLILQKLIPLAVYTVIIQVLFAFSCGALLG